MAQTKAPRPKNNKDGEKKKPSANPDGGPAAAAPSGAPQGPPNTAPPIPPGFGMLQASAAQMEQAGAAGPNIPGAGVPEGLQSFPEDVASLMQIMQQGFAPGADNMQHEQALNASAIARQQEEENRRKVQMSIDQTQGVQEMGGALQRMMGQGQAPPDPGVLAEGIAPQMATGPAPSGPASRPGSRY